jgi:hypothetical protein
MPINAVQLHAKAYYNDPNLEGAGDEFYISIPETGYTNVPVSGRSTSWELEVGSAWNQDTPFGGYLHVYAKWRNCSHAGFGSAVLTLTTTIPYWVSAPSGWYSQETWQAELVGTSYLVTRVTV